jgi:hypothetical protein
VRDSFTDWISCLAAICALPRPPFLPYTEQYRPIEVAVARKKNMAGLSCNLFESAYSMARGGAIGADGYGSRNQ